MAYAQPKNETKTIPLKVLVDKQNNKVVFVEATEDFVDTVFSFLSLPLATIVRLLATITNNDDQQQQSVSSPFLGNMKKLYQSVQNITSDDVWNNPMCKQMLLRPRNPCESLGKELFLNIDDTEPPSEVFVCGYCNKFTTFQYFVCPCGRPLYRHPRNLNSKRMLNISINGVFIRGTGQRFLVSDNLKILPSSMASSLMLLVELGCSDFTQLEEVTYNIGKEEILNLLKYTLTSHEPLTNTILKSSSKNKDSPTNPSAASGRAMPCTSDRRKIDIKVVLSKSQKKMVVAEANGDFVEFIFSILTMPLGSIVKLLGANSFAGCVGNLYKSVENLDSHSVLLNPGIAPQFGCPNQPLNIPHLEVPTYYYSCGEISETLIKYVSEQPLIALDPRALNRPNEGIVGFVRRATLYGVEDDLKVKPLSANFCLSYLRELNLPIDDVEVKVISFGESEALRFLGAFLTSKFTLTSGLRDFLNVPIQESTPLKVPKQES